MRSTATRQAIAQSSPTAQGGRGLGTAQVFARDGTLEGVGDHAMLRIARDGAAK